MIAAMRDVLVLTRTEFERLPEEGRWEVVEGSAILVPPPEIEHQKICDRLNRLLSVRLEPLGACVVSALSVFIPRPPKSYGEIQSRVPDVIVSRREPQRYFEAGEPPELVVEVLSTPRGNVERSEKIDDYAYAGISEYWIVDPFKRAVEVYRMTDRGEYAAPDIVTEGQLTPRAFPSIEIDIESIWTKK
ncbi:MAG TPA: Uma2 family endonuclease [Bryobacteraceae bacterium]|jgi:Uma2 family endonuclease|nr:Uma2 family endonuclease [Bryobacteraceae bacterium]